MAIAGIFALIAGVLVAQAAVFAIVAYDVALPWACLIVSGVLAAIAILFFAPGRGAAREESCQPERSTKSNAREGPRGFPSRHRRAQGATDMTYDNQMNNA